MSALDFLIVFLAISFLCYGTACLFTEHMISEFDRYGLPRFRRLTGLLEIAGAMGLILGYLLPVLQLLSATGIALLMMAGCIVRVKIKDRLTQIAPAFIYLLVSSYIMLELFTN
jgi:uncharacterized membrane protein YphA (DoxX/SURF4 family)